jgi:predicted metal-dependent enzyme (double-stranded beta helix superfamily)
MSTARLRQFVQSMTRVVENHGNDEAALLERGQALMHDLITHDDWLPAQFAEPNPAKYQQYLLYCDPFERFSLASFIWAPGQTTPVHDHTVWGMVGVMRGAERCEEFAWNRDRTRLDKTNEHRVGIGAIDLVSPTLGDIHTVSNALGDQVSISIHCYGANIGSVRRHVYEPGSGGVKEFVSGYSAAVLPNIWS